MAEKIEMRQVSSTMGPGLVLFIAKLLELFHRGVISKRAGDKVAAIALIDVEDAGMCPAEASCQLTAWGAFDEGR